MRRALTVGLLALTVAACSPDKHDPSDPSTIGTAGPSTGPTATAASTWVPSLTPTSGHPTGTPTPVGTVTPGLHDYGLCPPDGRKPVGKDAAIVGTSGDDTLRGTAKDEYICGMGGNDTIIGGGGSDVIWGGPGDDTIAGGPGIDFLYGNDGNDVVRGNNTRVGKGYGYDELYGDSKTTNFDDSGDDVLFGGTASTGERMYGGPGNDILAPTPIRLYTNYLYAGDGNDAVISVNFSAGPTTDLVDLDNQNESALPIGACKVVGQLKYSNEEGRSSSGAVACDMPWPKKLSSIGDLVQVSGYVDSKGKLTMEVKLYQELSRLSVSRLHGMTAAQADVPGDACICDPLVDKPPPRPFLPVDVAA